MLTTARTGEVIGATWSEFDLEAGVWLLPGERMKGGEDHTVHLVPRALEILEAQKKLASTHVFPSPVLDDSPPADCMTAGYEPRTKIAIWDSCH